MWPYGVAFALIVLATIYLISSSTPKTNATPKTTELKSVTPVTQPVPVETKKDVVPEIIKEVRTPQDDIPAQKEQVQHKELPKTQPIVQTEVEDEQTIQKEDIPTPIERAESKVEEPKIEVKTEEKTTQHAEREAPDTITNAGIGEQAAVPTEVDCEIVVTQYAFKARSDRELTIQQGDEVVLLIKNDSGWYRGQNLTTKHLGWFPNNYCAPTGKTMKLPIEFTYPEAVETAMEEEDDSQDQSQLKVASNKVQSKIAQIQQQLRDQNTENPVFT